jgi:UDP-2,3-diacylglucosamine pyrophosphatase LpxH
LIHAGHGDHGAVARTLVSMAAAQPDVADLLDVRIPSGGRVVAISDLHLPPERSDVSSRSCALIAARLAELASSRPADQSAAVTVVMAGDIIELLAHPEATADGILREHEDLCAALAAVAAGGGQVIYAIGNHDSDLAWDAKAADAVRELTGARLCLAADLVLPDGGRLRVEHGHQLDPYNCFCDPRNRLDTPLGHHIVREVLPRIEFLGRGWLDGAQEMADPGDFPSFVGSRLFYRKLIRHAWWLILIPVVLLLGLRVSEIVELETRYPDTARWVHGAQILGYGAVADLIVVAAIIGIVSRRAWTSISALALAERGYGQNQAARQRAADLTADGYLGFLSGHTHHPELSPSGPGFFANTGSCTTVVEGTTTRLGMPSAYLRAQQISWLELTAPGAGPGRWRAELRLGRIDLPGATRLERFGASGRHRFATTPSVVGSWPDGPAWPGGADITTGRSTSDGADAAAGRQRP